MHRQLEKLVVEGQVLALPLRRRAGATIDMDCGKAKLELNSMS
jgi:hypothetical protein